MINYQEERLQEQFATWLDSLGVLHCASMAGVNLPVRYAVRMKRKGYRRGFPDHFIYEPRGKWNGMAIELKVKNTAKNTDQDKWRDELFKRRYYYFRIPGNYDFWQAREALEKEVNLYLEGKI